MKRNLISEITAINSRSELNSWHGIILRIGDIEDTFESLKNKNSKFENEFIKYVPIRTISSFEAFFRAVYKELIDLGKPYSENAIKFNQSKNIKFDFDIINAIQEKTVSMGDFISHILPCNNFDDINSNLSTLLGINFLKEIKKSDTTNHFRNNGIDSQYFINNIDQIISDVRYTFELRHIFCHEFGANIEIDKGVIFRCFKNSKLFVEQSYLFISEILYPNAPETQAEMNNHAFDRFDKLETELSDLILTIKKATKKNTDMMVLNIELFDQTISEWKKYREAKAALNASIVEGGTMYPSLYAMSLATTTEMKINELKQEFKSDIKKYNT